MAQIIIFGQFCSSICQLQLRPWKCYYLWCLIFEHESFIVTEWCRLGRISGDHLVHLPEQNRDRFWWTLASWIYNISKDGDFKTALSISSGFWLLWLEVSLVIYNTNFPCCKICHFSFTFSCLPLKTICFSLLYHLVGSSRFPLRLPTQRLINPRSFSLCFFILTWLCFRDYVCFFSCFSLLYSPVLQLLPLTMKGFHFFSDTWDFIHCPFCVCGILCPPVHCN